MTTPPLEPYKPLSIDSPELSILKEKIKHLETDKRILARCLHNEMVHNGGHFNDDATYVWISQRFDDDECWHNNAVDKTLTKIYRDANS